MKKISFLLPYIFSSTFLFAQKKSLLECNDMKEKIILIQQSFDKLSETFKSSDKPMDGSDADEIYYNTEFKLCGQTASLSESKKQVFFKFSFDDSEYSGTAEDFNNFENKILTVLREVFGKILDDKIVGDGPDHFFLEPGKNNFSSRTFIYIGVEHESQHVVKLNFRYNKPSL